MQAHPHNFPRNCMLSSLSYTICSLHECACHCVHCLLNIFPSEVFEQNYSFRINKIIILGYYQSCLIGTEVGWSAGETASSKQPTGRLCKFCRKPIKQGPESPHVYHAFRGVAGRYIYCPARVLSLYKADGMNVEMTWGEFQQSDFYTIPLPLAG